MNDFLEILKYIIPAGVVFVCVYFLLKLFFEAEQKKRSADIKQAGYKLITPIRLQAYERLVLFLERISPESLIMREHQTDLSAAQFQSLLLKAIREEYEHNLSQQVYVSLQSWEILKNAKEEMIALVNSAAGRMDQTANATQLSSKIFEMYLSNKKNLCRSAIDFLKNEIRVSF